MNANDFLKYQLEDSGYQLTKCFEQISDANADSRVNEHTMSPRETLVHLAECYQAFLDSVEGIEHAWGTYTVADQSTANLVANWANMRAQAAAKVDGGDEANAKHASAFIVAHDYYHVGQSVSFLLTHVPGWDPYSIYRG